MYTRLYTNQINNHRTVKWGKSEIHIRNKDDVSNGKLSIASDLCSIQQRNCEAETLRVFRLITGQVFGRLLEENMDVVDGRMPKNIMCNDPAPLQISEIDATMNQNKPSDCLGQLNI